MNKNEIEIIKNNEKQESNDAVILDNKGLDVKKGGNIVIGTLNIFADHAKKRHERHYKESTFHFVADVVLVLIIISLVSAWLIIRHWQPEDNIELHSGHQNQRVFSGREETFYLDYKNLEDQAINNSRVTVNLPDGFVLKEAVPQNSFNKNTNTFVIGDLSSGANGKIKVIGFPYAEIGFSQDISFVFSYECKNKEIISLNSLHYNIEGSVFDLVLDMPSDVFSQSDFDGKFIVRNSGSREVNGLLLSVSDDLEIDGFEQGKLLIESLGIGEEKQIDFKARTSHGEGEVDFIASLSIKNGYKNFKQKEVNKKINIRIPKFKTSLESGNNIFRTASKIDYTFEFINNEEEIVKNIQYDLESSNKNFNIKKIELANEGVAALSGNTLMINKSINPGERSGVGLSVYYNKTKEQANQDISLVAKTSYSINDRNAFYTVSSQPAKVLSDISVNSVARYYSAQGDQLGVGPLPPVVDIPTSYWIIWELGGNDNDLDNFSLSANLGENVVWNESKSVLAGSLHYGEVGNRVVWNIDNIKHGNGTLKAAFEITLIPTTQNVGKEVDLLKNIDFNVRDIYCDELIRGAKENLDTSLDDDKLAKGMGTVKPLTK